VEQQARIKAEQEREQADLARLTAEEKAERKAQTLEAEQQARIKAERELQLADTARVKTEEKAKKERDAQADSPSKLKTMARITEQERQAQLALGRKKRSRKVQEAQAEQLAGQKPGETGAGGASTPGSARGG
jgi:hypothetical protein